MIVKTGNIMRAVDGRAVERDLPSSLDRYKVRQRGNKYCVSSIYIALVYIPGASGDHSKSKGCTKATPPPIAAGADH